MTPICIYLIGYLTSVFYTIQMDKRDNNQKVSEIDSSEWTLNLISSIVWPVFLPLLFCICTLPELLSSLCDALVKDRSIKPIRKTK